MTYMIAGGKSFNMVLSHVDHSDPATWRPETALADMRQYFKDWDPWSVHSDLADGGNPSPNSVPE